MILKSNGRMSQTNIAGHSCSIHQNNPQPDNNGGNYHLTTYQVLHDVIDSDMSDEEYDDALAEQFKGDRNAQTQ